MVKLRLCRIGRKNLPYYYIVAVCSRQPLKTRFIEKIGSYDCFQKKVLLNKELTLKLLTNGAQPSTTVKNILRREGVWRKFIAAKPAKKKVNVRPTPKSPKRIKKLEQKQAAKAKRRKTRLFMKKKELLLQVDQQQNKAGSKAK